MQCTEAVPLAPRRNPLRRCRTVRRKHKSSTTTSKRQVQRLRLLEGEIIRSIRTILQLTAQIRAVRKDLDTRRSDKREQRKVRSRRFHFKRLVTISAGQS
ncbi:hypothetical protein BDW74DRAFT_79009 [Aspergillus multicolor]|uniref:uncharacterized protein n=1 Tax=Aspergillus multicolor TaxID=41759 RepID=UPI003CCD52EE